jgi:hypothetical protein
MRWSCFRVGVGVPDSLPSYRVPLGFADVCIGLGMTCISIGTAGVSTFFH